MESSPPLGDGGSFEDKARILIVDDDPLLLTVLARVLERAGYRQVWTAVDAPNAQAILLEQHIDVGIADLGLPIMDGLALMQWAQKEHPETLWIILTGTGTFETAVQAVRLGAFDFLTKPLLANDSLVVTVRNALIQKRLVEEQDRLNAELVRRNIELDHKVDEIEDAMQVLSEQAETISQDLARAELVQRALLPLSTPPLGPFAFDALYRLSHKVGGDLYDVLAADDQHIVFYVADAAGHGLSAAFLAVLFKLRLRLRDEHTEHLLAPATILQEVNKALHRECAAPGLFITAALCLLNTSTGELNIASGGHPPLLLRRRTGDIEMVFHTGPALGLSPDAQYAVVTKVLHPGDSLLAYTDGVTDPGPNSSELSRQELCRLLNTPAVLRQDLLRLILRTVTDRHGGTGNEDDITLVLLTAGASGTCLDNGAPAKPSASTPSRPPTHGAILRGTTNGRMTFSIQHQACWTLATAFHETCSLEFSAGHSILLDLARCRYLDSTFLGTIQETVDLADATHKSFTIQGLLPEVKALFEELRMDRVLAHVTVQGEPLPDTMTPLVQSGVASQRNRQRILQAHAALAAIDKENHQKFRAVTEALQHEEQCT